MLRFIFYLVLSWLIFYLIRSLFTGSGSAGRKNQEAEGALDDEMLNCPECATFFPSRIAITKRAGGGRHSFCSVACAEKFAERGGPPGADDG